MKLSVQYYWLTCIATMLSACNNQADLSDLKAYITEIKIHASGQIEDLPPRQFYQAFGYPENNKDPFDSTAIQSKKIKVEVPRVKGIVINSQRKREFLESFSLESLKMLGTIQYQQRQWGLLKSTDNQVHRVKVGDYVGSNHGKIIKITTEYIQLLELIPNDTGAYKQRDNQIYLEYNTKNKHTSTTESKENARFLEDKSTPSMPKLDKQLQGISKEKSDNAL